jgi:acetyl esterase
MTLNIRTWAESALALDAHIPDGAGPFAAAILVHGGGWVAGDKQEYINYIFKPLSDLGFCLVQH